MIVYRIFLYEHNTRYWITKGRGSLALRRRPNGVVGLAAQKASIRVKIPRSSRNGVWWSPSNWWTQNLVDATSILANRSCRSLALSLWIRGQKWQQYQSQATVKSKNWTDARMNKSLVASAFKIRKSRDSAIWEWGNLVFPNVTEHGGRKLHQVICTQFEKNPEMLNVADGLFSL